MKNHGKIIEFWISCLHGLNLSRLMSVIVAWLGLIHKTEMHGEPVFGVAWCCQPHWMGHGPHPNLKMDVMIWWWLFIKSSSKTLQIFLKTPNSGHKMCEETMCNMWSCVFPFCNVLNYHGNLGFSFWNIIEKSLKFFKACLWEPWFMVRISSKRVRVSLGTCTKFGLAILMRTRFL